MPRILGVRERRDPGSFYDTHHLEPGQAVRFFRDSRDWRKPEDAFRTNMVLSGQFSSDELFTILGFGLRLVGKTRNEEDLLLDHVLARVFVGDMPQSEILGPHASMLRHVYDKEELGRLTTLIDEVKDNEHIVPPLYRAPAWLFAAPIYVPRRQSFHVEVIAARTLPAPVIARVHLFGLKTAEVTI